MPHRPRPVVQTSPTARILIAGQAPGTRVHASGTPFTDASGDRLRDWMGIDEELFYDKTKIAIVPMGFCFPGLDAKGGDLPPRKECAPAWRLPLMERLPGVSLILAVGQYAQSWHIEPALRRKSLTETVGNWREIYAAAKPRIIPLPHPSWRNSGWIKRHPWFETDLLPFLRTEISSTLS
ncbi:uracil-DNA glycosylase [Limoniibacter endophyticus]|uniref:Uracil-DNA glycosylase n=1 Tax=Limoniibacter endophyticus TaxID=1565040 RepID=A0A8J3GIA6_9HYPH|nr:uracil-DNA glycosylase [Limoniibacter endophyticus]